jgi:AraC-like DNA-binding protein
MFEWWHARKRAEILQSPFPVAYEILARNSFSDTSTFHRAFKRSTGTTPSKYLQGQQEQRRDS